MTSEPDETSVRCAKCEAVLAEPSNTPPETRRPCPTCGSTARVVALSASIAAASQVSALIALADDSESAVRAEIKLANANFSLNWLRLSEGGAWLLRAYNEHGEFIDGTVQDDPGDALLAVAERLLPEA